MKTEHILVIRFSAMGDVAMTVPVVYALAKQYPELRITMLSKPFARPFFENLAPNVSFMGADINVEYHGIRGLNTLYRRLTAKKFTAIADLHNVLRSNYLRMRFNFDNYKVAHIDKHRKERKALTRLNNKVLKPIPSAFENYSKVFEELGYPLNIEFSTLFPQPKIHLRSLPSIIGEKKKFQQWIGIAPFAAHEGKTYPLPLMEKVIEKIIKKYPSCRIFLFGGGQKEKALLDNIVEKYSHCTNIAGLLKGFHQELILIANLNLMVSMDSANMHLASLVATPVVSIWGATHPFAGFMGWNQRMENAVQIDLYCRPCSIFGNKPCFRNDYICLNRISPDMVFSKVESILNNCG